MEKRKVNIKNEKKHITEDVKNNLNPDHNSGNASCVTNEWPDYPYQPLSGEGRQDKIRKNHPQPCPRKNKQTRHTSINSRKLLRLENSENVK